MNNKIHSLSAVMIILSFAFVTSYGTQKAEWKGTIEIENGVKVVKNPREPLYGELVFDLEEDLSIGREDDENYLFYSVRDIGVDDDGNIYVLDRGNLRIQKYDRDGNYLCTMGRVGQGPGEFQWAFQLLIDDKNGIIGMLEGYKFIVYDKEGNHLDRDIIFERFILPMVVDSSGGLWGIVRRYEGEDEVTSDITKFLAKFSNEGQIAKEAAKFPSYQYRERSITGGVFGGSTGEEHDLHMELAGENHLVYGYSKEYELNIIDLNGNLVLKIRKDEPYRKFTAQERGKYDKRLKLPEHKPFFYYLYSDSMGRIYALKNNVPLGRDEERKFDVFSKDGYYLYTTTFTLNPFLIKDGFFYTPIVNNETGEVFVKRFRIKNWDRIKY